MGDRGVTAGGVPDRSRLFERREAVLAFGQFVELPSKVVHAATVSGDAFPVSGGRPPWFCRANPCSAHPLAGQNGWDLATRGGI